MELNNLDIKSYRNDEKKENLNIIKSADAVKNNKNQSKDKDRNVELNRISNLNINDNITKQVKEGDNLLNKLNNVEVNYVNKYNLNYDYNKLVNNNLNDKKDQLSSRNEKEKILHLINNEILKNENKNNDNYANKIIENMNKLQNNEYNYNERYDLGYGLNLNLNNLNRNIKYIQDIKIPNLNIEFEKALENRNLQNKGNIMEPSSIVNLNLNLNINNNIINNITSPNKINNEQNKVNEKSKPELNNIINSKRAVSAKSDLRNAKKDIIIDKLIKSIDNS